MHPLPLSVGDFLSLWVMGRNGSKGFMSLNAHLPNTGAKRGPLFARLRVPGLPRWCLNNFIEVLSPTGSPGQTQGPCTNVAPRKLFRYPRTSLPSHWASWGEQMFREECGYNINSQQIIHCFLNAQRPCFANVFFLRPITYFISSK